MEDEELVQLAQGGDLRAFEELVMKYERMVLGMAGGMVGAEEARDVAQAIFLETYASLRRFRRESSFKTWLTRLSLNQISKYLRGRKVRETLPLERVTGAGETILMDVPDETPGPDVVLDEREQSERLRGALQSLSVEYREAAILRFSQGMDYEEIAEVLGCALGTVKSRLHHAKILLMKALQEKPR